ncbi:MAG TPA: TraB/GumN family protein [Steroidobacteraceae bacterium]|nr:TraB/GumN family protein [Steroidobacteraceae bacterium]
MRALLLAFLLLAAATSRADGALHSLWELHGRHNTVYLLGSIHVLRPRDYPLAKPVLDAYADANAVVMEINLGELDLDGLQQEMLASALLPDGKTLTQVMGSARYAHAASLAHELGFDLAAFDQFAPWFVAEAISQLQLAQLGFQAESGVEMFFLDKARADGKAVAGLETAHDQIALFEAMSLESQAEYLLSNLEEAHELPREIDEMVHAWAGGDTAWFRAHLQQELGRDPKLYQSVLGARNRKWLPKIEALLNDDKNYLIIVGTGHLVGEDNVIELLKRDGIAAKQR